MILTVEEVKDWLKDIPDEENVIIAALIGAAEAYLLNATGNAFDDTNNLAKLFCKVLITDWYENREAVGKTTDKTRPVVESMLAQLKHAYDTGVDDE